MSIYDYQIQRLDGSPGNLAEFKGQGLLVVNVASKCGLTPQYEGLEQLHKTYSSQGFSVLGFPCNQFMGQEPGTAEEIQEFCSATYGVTFPMFEKIEVNGDGRHPLYQELTKVPDADGDGGDVKWNFEKFAIGRSGEVVARLRPQVEPLDGALISIVEKLLAED